ncbi:MAG: alkaline phosphatase family protein [Acidobacteria bacterium]|nr:alkaline phosphatase family protein [Acidobacteriota bacterium]
MITRFEPPMFRRRLLCSAAGLALILAQTGATAAALTAPKLVVILVVDQMRADYVDKYGHHWTAGLRRLVDQGAWFRQASYPYLPTVTCAGHATISTGTFPATHGMVLNAWWDRQAGRRVNCTEDPHAPLIGYGGEVTKGGDSASRLRAYTFTDELRAQSPVKPRIITLSEKPRSAIMLAGHAADAATWLGEDGVWVTSRAYAAAPVTFIEQFTREHPIAADFGKSWNLTLPEPAYVFAQSSAGLDPPAGWTMKWPHVLSGTSRQPDTAFYGQWKESPFADEYLARLAETAVDALALGQGPGIDFLGVSFSALDVVGHDFGPTSREVQDMLVRLDATIGRLLAHLDRKVGPDSYVVALTADHGVAPVPEQIAPLGFEAGRVIAAEIVERVEQALAPMLGPGKKVATMLFSELYFEPGIDEKLLANPAAMHAARDAIRSAPGIARVFRGEELRDGRAWDDPLARAVALTYFPGRSGDFVIVPKPYWLMSSIGTTSIGTTHGTANAYDTRVPIILMGHGLAPGQYLQPATPADIAPTLAFLCGITLPRPDGRVLAEAIRPASTSGPASTAPARSSNGGGRP